MKTERFILSIITILIGLLVAGVAFYFYQMANSSKQDKKEQIILSLSPTISPQTQLFQIDAPLNEEVVSKKTIRVKGKAIPHTTIAILSDSDIAVTMAAGNGEFSSDFTLINGTNILFITATFPDGQESKMQKVVTYSTESF